MRTFTLTQHAKKDLKSIARFTEKRWGRQQRNLYLKQFDEIFRLLVDTPSMGKACDFIKRGYRKFPKGSHVIYYKTGDEGNIAIIRILHKNMDIASNFTVLSESSNQ